MTPQIICHIMSSVDGRLLTDRWTQPFNTKSKGELMGIYAALGRRLDTDAWMFGKNTLCEGFFPRKFHAQETLRRLPVLRHMRPLRHRHVSL